MKCHVYYVYILASKSRRIYIGVTSNIECRTWEHKLKLLAGFTAKYNIDRLVYVQSFQYVDDAIAREKEIKGWSRAKKIALIEKKNPTWEDLAGEWFAEKTKQIPRSARNDNSEPGKNAVLTVKAGRA